MEYGKDDMLIDIFELGFDDSLEDIFKSIIAAVSILPLEYQEVQELEYIEEDCFNAC